MAERPNFAEVLAEHYSWQPVGQPGDGWACVCGEHLSPWWPDRPSEVRRRESALDVALRGHQSAVLNAKLDHWLADEGTRDVRRWFDQAVAAQEETQRLRDVMRALVVEWRGKDDTSHWGNHDRTFCAMDLERALATPTVPTTEDVASATPTPAGGGAMRGHSLLPSEHGTAITPPAGPPCIACVALTSECACPPNHGVGFTVHASPCKFAVPTAEEK